MVLNLKIQVEDEKVAYLLELIRNLRFVSYVTQETDEISDDLKSLLDERLKNHEAEPHSGITWEALKATL